MQGTIETRVGILVLGALGVFAYMGLQIGAFRFDRSNYNGYVVRFRDISGLSRKAEVKIAGVKVGWVESIKLIEDSTIEVEAKVMVAKEFVLYADAYAIVRQEGLLGPKYLEIIPGDPHLSLLSAGSALGKPSVAPVSVDEVMHQFKRIASNVETVTESFKDVLGGEHGKQELRILFDNLNETTTKLASFAQVLEASVSRNENKFDSMFDIGDHVARLSRQLQEDVLPSITQGINTITSKFESTAQALEDASLEVRDGFKNINSVTQKVDEGKGLLGKLINEDETYRDLKVAVQGLKNYFSKIDALQLVFDAHFESMQRKTEDYPYEDQKGYLDVRIHPTEDYFYLLQIVTSQRGFADHESTFHQYYDKKGNPVNPIQLAETFSTEQFFESRFTKFKRNTYRLGMQFGKIFNRVAVRCGIFENTAGIGVDFDIPLPINQARWVTTMEAFDFVGINHRHDRRVHVKWLNRIFVFNNLYATFGVDDFASKHSASFFFGGGLRFGDDDFKFLLSSFSGGVAGATSSSTR